MDRTRPYDEANRTHQSYPKTEKPKAESLESSVRDQGPWKSNSAIVLGNSCSRIALGNRASTSASSEGFTLSRAKRDFDLLAFTARRSMQWLSEGPQGNCNPSEVLGFAISLPAGSVSAFSFARGPRCASKLEYRNFAG